MKQDKREEAALVLLVAACAAIFLGTGGFDSDR